MRTVFHANNHDRRAEDHGTWRRSAFPRVLAAFVLLCLFGQPAPARGDSLEFEAGAIGRLVLTNVNHNIVFKKAHSPRVTLTLADDAGLLKDCINTTRDGNVLTMAGAPAGPGRAVSASRVSTGSVTNIQIGGGSATVNVGGVTGGAAPRKTIEITLPAGMALVMRLNGTERITGAVEFAEIKIISDGSSDIVLDGTGARRVDVSTAGSETVDIKGLSAAEVVLEAGGSSTASLRGTFKNVRLSASGSAAARTEGDVQGRYEANLDGSSAVRHHGTVGGEIVKRVSESAELSIR